MTERISSDQDWASNTTRYPIVGAAVALPGCAPFNTTLTAVAPAANRFCTIPAISADAQIVTTTENQSIDGSKNFTGSLQFQTLGGTPSPFNYYEESILLPITDQFQYINGPTAVNLTFIRVGGIKSITMVPQTSFPLLGDGVITSTTGVIPARFRPSSNQYFIIQCNGGGAVQVVVLINTAGSIFIGNAPTTLGGNLTNLGFANLFIQNTTLTYF